MSKVKELDRIADALVQAAISANNVMMRKHIVPSRNVRVGEFVTCIRRELAAIPMPPTGTRYGRDTSRRDYWMERLTNTDCWFDILELYGNGFKINAEAMHVVELAQSRMTETSPAIIEFNLRKLDETLDNTESFLTRIQENNEEAGRIMDEFELLINSMKRSVS